MKPKVFLLHSGASPYRLPLFESLSKEVNLEVFYCNYRAVRRRWSIPLSECSFKYRVLKCFNLGPFMINPTLPVDMLLNRHDVYILGEDQRIFFSELIGFLMAKLFGKPIIIWSGFTEKNYFERFKNIVDKYFLRPVYKFIYRYSDVFIAYGGVTKQYLINRGVLPQKILTGTQSLCSKQLMKYREDIDRSKLSFKDRKVILCVSYFDSRKGINYLIEAYKMLNRNDAILIIAGSGKEEENLKSLANGRDDIYFPGYVEAEAKAYYYSLADIFVFPTLSDAWGLVVNEAMMFGLPIITTNEAGCAQELIKGNGFVVKAGSIFSLKKALKTLLENEPLRREMGNKSKEIIGGCTIENAKKTFTDAIDLVFKS